MFNKTTKKTKTGLNPSKPKRLQAIDLLVNQIAVTNSLESIQAIDNYILSLKIENKALSVKKRIDYEFLLQYAVVSYLKRFYPDVLFSSDDSGVNKSQFAGSMRSYVKKDDFKIPDLQIMVAKNGFHGLFIELKTKDCSPFLKDGSLSKNEHVQSQYESLKSLSNNGYLAVFGVGFSDAISTIKKYLK